MTTAAAGVTALMQTGGTLKYACELVAHHYELDAIKLENFRNNILRLRGKSDRTKFEDWRLAQYEKQIQVWLAVGDEVRDSMKEDVV